MKTNQPKENMMLFKETLHKLETNGILEKLIHYGITTTIVADGIRIDGFYKISEILLTIKNDELVAVMPYEYDMPIYRWLDVCEINIDCFKTSNEHAEYSIDTTWELALLEAKLIKKETKTFYTPA